MDSFPHWWRGPHPGINLAFSLLVIGLVLLFVLLEYIVLEYALDGPLWHALQPSPASTPPPP